MSTLTRRLVEFCDRRVLARPLRAVPFLGRAARLGPFNNPMFVSSMVINRRGAHYVAPRQSYLANGSTSQQVVQFDASEFDPELTYLFELLIDEADVVVDVGANVGVHTVALARRARAGHVFAFEPVRELAEQNAVNCALNRLRNVTIVNCALGAEPATLTMHVNTSGNGLEGTSTFIDTYHRQRAPARYQARSVPVRRLDDIVPELVAPRRIAFMKIDTEGYDTFVLEGAMATIRAHRPAILVEAHSARLRSVGKSWRWYLDTFPDYHVLIFPPVSHLKPQLELRPLTDDQEEIAGNLLLLPRTEIRQV
jgi:FkbM family methyltransferase